MECSKIILKIGEKNMKKFNELLNEVVAMGFSREKAFSEIDENLDEFLEERNTSDSLMNEEIPDKLYSDILEGFIQEKEMDQNV